MRSRGRSAYLKQTGEPRFPAVSFERVRIDERRTSDLKVGIFSHNGVEEGISPSAGATEIDLWSTWISPIVRSFVGERVSDCRSGTITGGVGAGQSGYLVEVLKYMSAEILPRRFPERVRFMVGCFLLFGTLLLGGVSTVSKGRSISDTGDAINGSTIRELVSSGDVAQQTVPWYHTAWAYVIYAGIAVGLIVGFVCWRMVSLRRTQRTLEHLVELRTTDVQSQKEQLEAYNRELLRANESLRETVEEKSRLLGMAAHDLKNPLFGIRALSEIVLETESLSAKSEKKLNLIRESADETLHLIDGLLTSAAASSQTGNDWEALDVAELVRWVVQSFEPQAVRKDQTIHCRVPEEASVVLGDKRRLREALNNLISNALKYSPPGEAVNVVVERDEEFVRVAVADAGPGLSEMDKERMFAPFQRLSARPTGGEGSSGLGLYIVKQIVELHDGSIEVETEPGKGSTFTLVLPTTRVDADPVPETPRTTDDESASAVRVAEQ